MKRRLMSKKPVAVEVEAGKTYFWCACGTTKTEPFCDGSHSKTQKRPKMFKADKSETVFLCTCKKTKNPPFCDGSHGRL
ncbi:MAG: CDGSH iron-sulfur domain-containing protein [Lentisphaeraceae bacterium]|nr:CDGSH iron-sulfur domain-containing protein [Lentisphaeraceae bacterium]